MKLRDSTIRAGRWTILSAAGRLGLQLLQTMVLARLLAPHDFGTMAVVSGFLAIVSVFADFGLSRSLIHFQSIPNPTLSTLYWLNLVISCALASIIASAAPLIGWFYENPAMAGAVSLSCLVFPLTAGGLQFRVLAEKKLEFKSLAYVDLGAAFVGALFAIASARVAPGVYALVIGTLTTALTSSILAWVLLSDNWRPTLHFDRRGIGPYLSYGLYLGGENLANMIRMQIDVIVAGSVASASSVGFYSVTKDLSLRVANNIVNPIVTRLGLPIMARAQSDRLRLKNTYLAVIRIVSALNFPLYILLGCFSQDIVLILYGDQWEGAAFYLKGFAAWGLIRSTGNPVGILLYGAGQTRRALNWNIGLLVIVGPIIWLNTFGGNAATLMWTLILTQAVTYFLAWRFLIKPVCGASFYEYAAQSIPALLASLAAGSVSLAGTFNMQGGWIRFMLGTAIAVVVYIGLSWFINREWIQAMGQMLGLPRTRT